MNAICHSGQPVPEELLTVANHLLGKGQTSLAKYLFIACHEDDPQLSTHDIPGFFHTCSAGLI